MSIRYQNGFEARWARKGGFIVGESTVMSRPRRLLFTQESTQTPRLLRGCSFLGVGREVLGKVRG